MSRSLSGGWLLLWLLLVEQAGRSLAAAPVFDPATRMRTVLVPSDTAVGTVIYRLRASDDEFDYPLHFELLDGASSSAFSVDSLPCTRYNSVCQANVVLRRRLERGRYYDFRVKVADTSGDSATLDCAVSATNGTTPIQDTFPKAPGLIMVLEDAKRGTELEFIIARKNPLSQKPVYLELWGSPLFAIRQRLTTPDTTEGVIFLLGPLDFETQSMHHLTILANDAFPNPRYDSRNIFELRVAVAVQDVQDTPPVFSSAPPVTSLAATLLPGDVVARVKAEDGDRGKPRPITYGLVSEGNPFTTFFSINETTGVISLARPLDEAAAISHAGAPILITVVAEEVKVSRQEPPAQASTVQLAFLLPDRSNSPPYFDSDSYVVRVDENSPQGTTLFFPDPPAPRVRDDDPGDKGVFSLQLINNNGTFEISPSVGDRDVTFLIRVRDPAMLDFEKMPILSFQIVAQELGPTTNLSAIANVTIFLNDVNDNPPIFLQPEYRADLAENATAGTRVIQVQAKDEDTGSGGRIRYSRILGYRNTSLKLDSETGWITVATNNHGFDSEEMPEYSFLVEARDADGEGNAATASLTLSITDVNDNAPHFERDVYEFMLSSGLNNFTVPAFLHATDADATSPNNEVRYEIVHGNYDEKFRLDDITGELTVNNVKTSRDSSNKQSGSAKPEVYAMTVRAYDLGVPHMAATTSVRIYPPESRARSLMFVVPGSRPDLKATADTIRALTGAAVTIEDVRPHDTDPDKSIVLASLHYTSNSVVDVDQIQRRLSGNYSAAAIATEQTTAQIYRGDSSNLLFWLLIFLALAIACAILALILCCICAGCPLYMPPRKRVVATEDGVRLVHRSAAEKTALKGGVLPQNVEWTRAREAWSAEAEPRTRPTHWQFNRRNNQQHSQRYREHSERDDALAAREDYIPGPGRLTAPERGPDGALRLRDGPNVIYTRDVQLRRSERDLDQLDRLEKFDRERLIALGQADERRDQRFIREGDAEILQLMTRGGREDALSGQYVLVDGGKELLMRRFMEEDLHQTQTMPTQEPPLEESLREQNALLRRILLEKERLLLLQETRSLRGGLAEALSETQSLPGHAAAAVAGTQTDRSAGTQTDPRRTRSDLDESPGDEDDEEDWRRRRRIRRRKQRRVLGARRIRTPIAEEDSPAEDHHQMTSSQANSRKSKLAERSDVLAEISDSLDERHRSAERTLQITREPKYVKAKRQTVQNLQNEDNGRSISADSLEDKTPAEKQGDVTNSGKTSTEGEMYEGRLKKPIPKKRQMTTSADKSKGPAPKPPNKIGDGEGKHEEGKDIPKYMQWYFDQQAESKKKSESAKSKSKPKTKADSSLERQSHVKKKPTIEVQSAKPPLINQDSNHSLTQHSEYRYEHPSSLPQNQVNLTVGDNKMKTMTEDDQDSGIAMTSMILQNLTTAKRNPIAEKKSVFTIAYDDMRIKQLRSDSNSPPY